MSYKNKNGRQVQRFDRDWYMGHNIIISYGTSRVPSIVGMLFLNRLDEIHFGKRYNWIYLFSCRSKSHCYGTYLWSALQHIVDDILLLLLLPYPLKRTRTIK